MRIEIEDRYLWNDLVKYLVLRAENAAERHQLVAISSQLTNDGVDLYASGETEVTIKLPLKNENRN